jgi:hypothetical protein
VKESAPASKAAFIEGAAIAKSKGSRSESSSPRGLLGSRRRGAIILTNVHLTD